MAFRNLVIRHKSKLFKYYGFLDIKLNNNQYKVPFSDISTLIIDTQYCTITTSVINALTKNNILILISDKCHLPKSLILPYNRYFSKLPILNAQIRCPNRVKGRLWQKIIKRKILNEIHVMTLFNKPVKDMDILRKNVSLYDKKHCESIAARIYFERLFGKYFGRRNTNIINANLNYGYSIIFSSLARFICAKGLEPAIGLWHHNQQNSFNLADDLIEPFRSIIDLYVVNILRDNHNKSNKINKIKLLHLLLIKVSCDKHRFSITKAIQIEVNSYKNCLLNHSTRIILPKFYD